MNAKQAIEESRTTGLTVKLPYSRELYDALFHECDCWEGENFWDHDSTWFVSLTRVTINHPIHWHMQQLRATT